VPWEELESGNSTRFQENVSSMEDTNMMAAGREFRLFPELSVEI
jgi:hypothetical protein